MHDHDDEIIDRYEREFEPEPEPLRRGSNRGFWIVVGTIGLAAIILVVEILANRPVADTIARAQHDLRAGQAAAEAIQDRTGSFADAGSDGLNREGMADGVQAVAGDEVSSGPGEISVSADRNVWAAAVTVRPGACFYLKLATGEDPTYGNGTVCTGVEARSAVESRW